MVETLPQVTEQLEEDIVFGRRRPRERLVEEELVAQFGAKKHVIRQSLAELERMGLVERKRNKGAMVRDYTPEDVRQVFALRELLEAEAARNIPLPAPPEILDSLLEIHDEHSAAVEAGDLRGAFRANLRFHRVLFGACGNPYLAEAIDAAAFKTHGVRSYSLANPVLLRGARDDHGAMIESLASGNRERLVALCVRHLKPTVSAYTEAYEQVFATSLRRSA